MRRGHNVAVAGKGRPAILALSTFSRVAIWALRFAIRPGIGLVFTTSEVRLSQEFRGKGGVCGRDGSWC
jgi:hypothetical protein